MSNVSFLSRLKRELYGSYICGPAVGSSAWVGQEQAIAAYVCHKPGQSMVYKQ